MQKMKILLGSILICVSYFSMGQRTMDIGVVMSKIGSPSSVEFRKSFNEKFKYRIALDRIYWKQSPFLSKGKIIKTTDTSYTKQTTFSKSHELILRGGIERRLRESMFSIGADVLFGHRNSIRSESTRTTFLNTFNSASSDQLIHDFQKAEFNKPIWRKSQFVTTGLRLNAAMDIPIKTRFFLNLQCAYNLKLNVRYKYTTSYGTSSNANYNYFLGKVNLALGLRYRFGKEV